MTINMAFHDLNVLKVLGIIWSIHMIVGECLPDLGTCFSCSRPFVVHIPCIPSCVQESLFPLLLFRQEKNLIARSQCNFRTSPFSEVGSVGCLLAAKDGYLGSPRRDHRRLRGLRLEAGRWALSRSRGEAGTAAGDSGGPGRREMTQAVQHQKLPFFSHPRS